MFWENGCQSRTPQSENGRLDLWLEKQSGVQVALDNKIRINHGEQTICKGGVISVSRVTLFWLAWELSSSEAMQMINNLVIQYYNEY